jgi:elongation factor G
MGRMAFLRALEPLPANRPLGGRAPGHLTPADAGDQRHLDEVAEGEIVSAVKADHLTPGRLASQGDLHAAPGWLAALPAMLHRLITPVEEREGVKLSGALATLAESDAGLTVTQDPVTGGALAGLQGPLHLRSLRARLKEVFGLEVTDLDPSPAYRETITKSHEIAYRHKKQTGGAGQFADVKFVVAPAARGAGFAFDEAIKGGAVPRNYIPAVETGARDAMERGPLGFPVVDVAVTLTDGSHHPVDSSDMAFRIAARRGVGDALEAAGPVLLQPIFHVDLHVPEIYTGAFGPIVSALHGQVLGFVPDPKARGWQIFEALLPAAALPGLANDVRASTHGVGWFSAAFDHYEEVHGKAAERVLKEHAGEPA